MKKRFCVMMSILMAASMLNINAFNISTKAANEATMDESYIYRIVNVATNKCFDISDGSSANNAKLQTFNSNGTKAQQFRIKETAQRGYYNILPLCAPLRAIDNPNESMNEGVQYQTWTRNGYDAQDFKFELVNGNIYKIINKKSNLTLEDVNGAVKQQRASNSQNQQWRVEKVKKSATFTNPIKYDGADPWVIRAGDNYYQCYSDGNICITKSKNLEDLGSSKAKTVYRPNSSGNATGEFWAPELFYLNGHWYIYFAADCNNGDNFTHRMFVLEGGTNANDPMDGNYTLKGKLYDSAADKWAIDGTVFTYNNQMYFVWSGWEGDNNVAQNLYIAKMSNPYTLSSNRVCISRPEKSWETIGDPKVNEGPEVLVKGNSVHIIYSASGSWTDDYCLGRITCSNGDFLNPSAWSKSNNPVFRKSESIFGPGHASFVKSPDGKQDFIVYHAAKKQGSGWDRNVHTQLFTWHGNEPFFGECIDNEVELEVPSKDGGKKVDTNKYYLIKNVATKRVMDIPNGTDANSLQIRTWDENKTSAQLYKFNLKDDFWYVIEPKCASGRAIDNPSASLDRGKQYQTWQKNNADAQSFRLEQVGENEYRIINKGSLLALADSGNNDGNAVRQQKLSNDDSQKWQLIEYVEPQPTTQKTTEAITEKPTEVVTQKPTEAVTKTIESQLFVIGNQISANLNGMRTLYSVEDKINNKKVVESGLVYSLADYVEASELYYGSNNKYVKSFKSTQKGKCSNKYNQTETSATYAMTILFSTNSKKEMSEKWRTRAYAKLEDGSIAYSKAVQYSPYSVADYLYQHKLMVNEKNHNYLFTNILTIVDSNYQKINY